MHSPSALCTREDWESFLGCLHEVLGKPSCYEHATSGVVYTRGTTLGKGVYGSVNAYTGAPACANDFCVKHIEEDASDEVDAVEWVSRQPTCVRRAVVESAVLSKTKVRDGNGEVYERADIGMRVYDTSFAKYTEKPGSPAFARAVCVALLSHVQHLWDAGAAYCDMKPQNVLCMVRDGKIQLVLGDLGSIALREGGRRGLFTFPPRRAIRQSKSQDGVAVPEERDMVWGIAIIMLSILKGGAWVNSRLCCSAIRSGVRGGDAEAALDRCSSSVRRAISLLRSSHRDSTDMEPCARAAELALRGWDGGDATLDDMRRLLTEDCPVTPPRPTCGKRSRDGQAPAARNIFPT